ncbi:nucleotide-binding protein [Paenibacillus sp. Soil522]|uniref:nucleotide-binding protein n=1 Tax=Paenibacillus sp. Soil522 TaxID=1736388 RepID=UPI0006F5467F|nr:hypothetical protein [Paenibacillus sp. Soil522]
MSPISEAYKILRTNIEFSNVDEKIQTIMLTSTKMAEGESTTFANLAVAYAQSNKKVLLIDTPPVLVVTDAQIVAAQCDGVIMVIDSGRVKNEAALKAKVSLELVKARMIGVIINNINRNSTDGYYYGERKEK